MAPFIQAFEPCDRRAAGLAAARRERRGASASRACSTASGRLLTDLLPELERLVGPQPESTALGPAETENRLLRLLSAFVRVLAEDGPLVLFLDDLQWADASTLKLLRHLATDEPIANATAGRRLSQRASRQRASSDALAAMREARAPRSRAWRSRRSTSTRSRRCWSRRCARLRRTSRRSRASSTTRPRGNPLFIRRLLRFLWQAKLLAYDRRTESYAWNRARIAELPVTENVADLLVAGMQRLAGYDAALLEVRGLHRHALRPARAGGGDRLSSGRRGSGAVERAARRLPRFRRRHAAHAAEPEPDSAAQPPTARTASRTTGSGGCLRAARRARAAAALAPAHRALAARAAARASSSAASSRSSISSTAARPT